MSTKGFLTPVLVQAENHLANLWPAGVLAILAVIPFLGDQHPVPSQDRIRREQSTHFFESFSSKDPAFDRQSTALVVVQHDPLVAVRFLEHLVLGSQVFDHFLLLPIDPACQTDQIQLPGLENEIHDRSIG